MKPIVIILITYERTEYTIRTIRGITKHLKHEGGLSWYVCDDGSKTAHFTAVIDELKRLKQHICGSHSEKLGYGGGVNKGWRIASQTSPVTLWVEDDWELREYLDLTPYYDLLDSREGVGMIRLGHMPIGQGGDTVGYNGRMYLQIDKGNQYAFSGNPHLKHDRFMLLYGDYPLGKNPGNTEIAYDWQVRNNEKGPAMLWPLSKGDSFLFHHIGEAKSY